MADQKNDLLRKLRALAERGEPGERENARAILAGLMEKYGVEEGDLQDDALDEHRFVSHNTRERSLLVQVIYKVTDGARHVYSYRKGQGSKNTICCKCTKAEAVQIGIEFDFYRELWQQELDLFYKAFIYKHEIFSSQHTNGESPKLSDEEIARIALMMHTMSDRSPRPALEEVLPQ